MKNLEKLVKEHTNEEGQIDWSAVEELVNKETNDIVAASTKKATDKAKEDLLKELEIDDPKAIKDKLNLSEELSKKLEEKENALNELTGKATKLEREKLLYSQGITDPDTVDYILFNVDKRVNEENDFDAALNAFKEEKPQYFQSEPITTGTKPGGASKREMAGFEKILAEKHPNEFKEEN